MLAMVVLTGIGWIAGHQFRAYLEWGRGAALLCLIPALTIAIGVALYLWFYAGTGAIELDSFTVFGIVAVALACIHSTINALKSRRSREAIAFRKALTAGRAFFIEELRKERPALRDEWYPWLLAFELGKQVDAWSTQRAGSDSPLESVVCLVVIDLIVVVFRVGMDRVQRRTIRRRRRRSLLAGGRERHGGKRARPRRPAARRRPAAAVDRAAAARLAEAAEAAGDMDGSSAEQWALHVTQELQDGAALLTLGGRVAAASADALRAALDAALTSSHHRLVIDCEALEYISSAGVFVLDRAREKAQTKNGHLVLCRLPKTIQLALDLAGIGSTFAIEASREEAIARLHTQLTRPTETGATDPDR